MNKNNDDDSFKKVLLLEKNRLTIMSMSNFRNHKR